MLLRWLCVRIWFDFHFRFTMSRCVTIDLRENLEWLRVIFNPGIEPLIYIF
jgi:hypothetical protein